MNTIWPITFGDREFHGGVTQAEGLLEHFKNESDENYVDELLSVEENEGQFYDVTTKEFNKAISKIKDKSVGADQIQIKDIRFIRDSAKDQLRNITESLFRSGVVPKDWKISIIFPIFKPRKDKKKASNYRPIALTSHIDKIAERIILQRLEWREKQINLFQHICIV